MPATLTDGNCGIFYGKIKFLLNIGLFAYKLTPDEPEQIIFQGICNCKISTGGGGVTCVVYLYHGRKT